MKRNVLNVVVIVALCLVGISACKGGPTAPPAPTLSVSLAPQTLTVPNGGTTKLTLSDPDAVCKAPATGKINQVGAQVEYITPAVAEGTSPYEFGGVVNLQCDKPGFASATARVTVSRQAVIEYNRPPTFVESSPFDSVLISMFAEGQFGWGIQNCSTVLVSTSPKKVWRCVRDLAPGTYYAGVGDSWRTGGFQTDEIRVWGVLVTNTVTIPGATGKAVKFEITAEYQVR